MRKVCLAILVLCAIAGAANAQQRVFVSAAHGDDTNPCSVPLPCRSFAHAIGLVFANGEILALDSGGYGPVSVTMGVSIVGPLGVEASVTQSAAGRMESISMPAARRLSCAASASSDWEQETTASTLWLPVPSLCSRAMSPDLMPMASIWPSPPRRCCL